jgi:hypothetical protein
MRVIKLNKTRRNEGKIEEVPEADKTTLFHVCCLLTGIVTTPQN